MSGLREALAEAIRTQGDGGPISLDEWYLSLADAALAALPEHRDEVRALIGDEQISRRATLLTPAEAIPGPVRDGMTGAERAALAALREES